MLNSRWARRALFLLLGLVLLLAAAIGIGLLLAQQRMGRVVDVPRHALVVPSDAQALERGRYLYMSRACVECHGANGAGRVLIDQDGMKVAGPKIGPGAGSATTGYEPADWERAIRHGVDRNGRPLIIMPSEDYNRLTDADLGAIVAFVSSLPDVPGGAAVLELPLPFKVLSGYGLIPDSASRIDHRLPPEQPVAEGITVAHGRYVAQMCLGCHGDGYRGGPVPGAPPEWPPAARLAPGEGSVMPRYADADRFVAMMRSGRSPEGKAIAVMPFAALGQMSDTDLRALHVYLQSLPAPR